MVGCEDNLLFLDALKRSVSKLILPEKNLKGIKTVFFKIQVSAWISELLDFSPEITMPNSVLGYENLPVIAYEFY